MGITVKWDITYKCNLNCDHCLNGDLLYKVEDELTTEGVKQVIDHLSEVQIDYVHLLGGEPTSRRDIVEIANYFKEKKIAFGLNTNGLKMASPELEEIMDNEYLRNVVISLEGPTVEINDMIRGKSVFEKVTQGFRKFVQRKKENGLDYFYTTVNTVVSKQNYDYILDMFDLCIDLGVDEFNLLDYIDTGNANKKNFLTFDEEIQLLKNLGEIYPKYKDQLRLKPKFARPLAIDYAKQVLGADLPMEIHACGAGATFAFINNRGELYPCDRYVSTILETHDPKELRLSNIPFYEVWGKEHFENIFSLTIGRENYQKYSPCNECEHLRKTCFPCPIYGVEKELVVMEKCRAYMNLLQEVVKEGEAHVRS